MLCWNASCCSRTGILLKRSTAETMASIDVAALAPSFEPPDDNNDLQIPRNVAPRSSQGALALLSCGGRHPTWRRYMQSHPAIWPAYRVLEYGWSSARPSAQEKESIVAFSVCANPRMFLCRRVAHGKQSSFMLCQQSSHSGTCLELSWKHVNAGGSAILRRKSLLRDDCILHHEFTHVGPDHFITMRSWNDLFMLANVHVEPNSTLRKPG